MAGIQDLVKLQQHKEKFSPVLEQVMSDNIISILSQYEYSRKPFIKTKKLQNKYKIHQYFCDEPIGSYTHSSHHEKLQTAVKVFELKPCRLTQKQCQQIKTQISIQKEIITQSFLSSLQHHYQSKMQKLDEIENNLLMLTGLKFQLMSFNAYIEDCLYTQRKDKEVYDRKINLMLYELEKIKKIKTQSQQLPSQEQSQSYYSQYSPNLTSQISEQKNQNHSHTTFEQNPELNQLKRHSQKSHLDRSTGHTNQQNNKNQKY